VTLKTEAGTDISMVQKSGVSSVNSTAECGNNHQSPSTHLPWIESDLSNIKDIEYLGNIFIGTPSS